MSHRSDQQTMRRVLIYGAGRGGVLVVEMLEGASGIQVMGFVDDNPGLWGQRFGEYGVVGGRAALEDLYRAKRFDALVLSMATPTTMHVRTELYLSLKRSGYRFINAIHPAAIISPSAHLGENNVISAGAVIGTAVMLGDNNRISSHCTIEHHSILGSHNFFGAHCVTGGAVVIGDSNVFGMGAVIDSLLQIGNQARIANGTVVSSNVPDHGLVER